MRNAPIPLVLAMWESGTCASTIAERLGFPDHRHITRIIANARRLRDPRARLHVYPNGRYVGNLRHALRVLAAWPTIKTVVVKDIPA